MRRPGRTPTRRLHEIVERFGQLVDRFEVILVLGSDYTDVATGTELSFNAKIAANLGSPVVLVGTGVIVRRTRSGRRRPALSQSFMRITRRPWR